MLPPIAEQDEILESIANESQGLNDLASRIRIGIAKLRELRSTLIAAAVTGKIDVRGEAVEAV